LGPAIRAYRAADLGRVVELWFNSGRDGAHGMHSHELVSLVNAESSIVLVAEEGNAVVGAALGVTTDALGWVHQLAVAQGADEEAVTDRLLDRLESEMSDRGVAEGDLSGQGG
jgi:hypothetical protein